MSVKPTNAEGIVDIFSDGACKGNPGIGGWGALLRIGATEKELFGGETDTTNNRMELMAVIRALQALKRPCEVRVHTDSVYVQKGISEWIANWKRNGWRTSAKQPVKNADLWPVLWAPRIRPALFLRMLIIPAIAISLSTD